MESENLETKDQQNYSLNKVTPLSKYLAMLLFVALPFIGGWIGYTYAPEKVIEVEKIVNSTVQIVPMMETTVTWDIGAKIDESFNDATVTLTLPSGDVKIAHVNVRNDCKELNSQNMNDEWIKKVNAGAVFEKEPNIIKPGLACVNNHVFAWYGVFSEGGRYYVKQLNEDASGLGKETWQIIGEIPLDLIMPIEKKVAAINEKYTTPTGYKHVEEAQVGISFDVPENWKKSSEPESGTPSYTTQDFSSKSMRITGAYIAYDLYASPEGYVGVADEYLEVLKSGLTGWEEVTLDGYKVLTLTRTSETLNVDTMIIGKVGNKFLTIHFVDATGANQVVFNNFLKSLDIQ